MPPHRGWLLQSLFVFAVFTGREPAVAAPNSKANYDESKVPQYVLPDPLVGSDGQSIKTADDWRIRRRPEILRLFETQVYGRAPQAKPQMQFEDELPAADALDGLAIRKQIAIHLLPPDTGRAKSAVTLHLLLYLPKSDRPRPVFLGLNVHGNQAVYSDPQIPITQCWVRNEPKLGIENNRATEGTRGLDAEQWQVEELLKRGYGVATMYYGDIEPDFDDGFQTGVHPLYYRSGQQRPDADQWGAIAAWAWGLSRAMDYLTTDPQVDAKRVAVWGHSRLGKTALWAGATDERFALVISNESGSGGAALSRRRFGETAVLINERFPHWFCGNFHKYNNRVDDLPVDQHMLIALIAPRPVYIATAAEDHWGDPRGSFLAARAAAPVYDLFYGKEAEPLPDDIPPLSQSVGNHIAYHIRPGKHDVTAFDWQQYLTFANRHFGTARQDATRR